MSNPSDPDYRFEIALSFAGDNKRDLVRKVAELLRNEVGEGKVFFDEWFEAELAGPDAQALLQTYYGKKTRLVVTCVCERYGEKSWTQEEWRAIQAFERTLRDAGSNNVKRMRFLPLRFGDGEIDGLFETAIVPDVRNRTAVEITELILERLRLAQDNTKVASSPNRNEALSVEDILGIEEKVGRIRVNREEEKQLLKDMVTGQSPVRALVIEAESGMGKSKLIEDFVHSDSSLLHVIIDFKNASHMFGDVLFTIREGLQPNNFPTFDAVCRDILRKGNAPELPALLASQVDGVLLDVPRERRDQQKRQLFEALSSDLNSLERPERKPIVLIIDTFEKASDSLKRWIGCELIPRISASDDIIWVIAG